MKFIFTSGFFILILHSFVCGQTLNKQNTYLDALDLAAIFRQNKSFNITDNEPLKEKYYAILSKYNITEDNISNNPLLAKFKITRIVVSSTIPQGTNPSKSVSSPTDYASGIKAPSLASINWQAAAINGLSNYMAGRFKEEVMHMGINLMFKQIKDTSITSIINYVFPKTYSQISSLYGQGQNSYYTADLVYLQKIIQSDYAALPTNLMVNAENIFPKLKEMPDARDMLTAGYNIYKLSRDGGSPPEIITSLSALPYSSSSRVKKVFELADVFSTALLDTAGSKTTWINPLKTFSYNDYEAKKPEVMFFYALLYEQIKNEPRLAYALAPYQYDIRMLSKQINEMVAFVAKLNSTYNYLKTKEFSLSTIEEQVFYMKEVQQALQIFATNELTAKIFELKQETIQICGSYITIVENLLKKEYPNAIALLTIELGNFMEKKYPRTLSFISQLATIDNAKDMERFVSAYSLPIGSASIKRRSKSNWSLNGYVGLTAGAEKAYGNLAKETKMNVGLAAPIGLAYTFQTASKNTFTLFGSFIDLGSIVNVRLGNDTTSYNSLRFEHFLSPGIGLFYNWKNVPISMGLNFNYISNLRTIQYKNNNATITETGTNVTRINFSLLVDIPFLTIFNKEK